VTCGLLDFMGALAYVRAQLTDEEHAALRHVTIRPAVLWRHPAGLRGCFVGVQAERDRVLEGELAPGARAWGQITIFLKAHRPGALDDLAVTIRHEIDHALGFGETDVLNLAAGRRVTLADVSAYRPYWKGHRIIYPKGPIPERRKAPPRKRPTFG
jgi:hypothetical protein